jgi:hypothetical protein
MGILRNLSMIRRSGLLRNEQDESGKLKQEIRFQHSITPVLHLGKAAGLVVRLAVKVSGHFFAIHECLAPVISLPSSRNHNTELATTAQKSQLPALRLTVENACCRNGM